jgi:peptidoglycan/xylan/chitin deacetylase (PgdA/CDA1 family)
VAPKPLFFSTITLSVAVTLLAGCGTQSTNSISGPEVKKQSISNAVPSNVIPTSTVNNQQAVTRTEVPPTSHSSYPQHATEHLVPEIWSVPRRDVAITIDDGPSPYTEQIIQVLNRYHVHASFFFIGNRVPLWPNAVRDAIASGDVVGNHSESHPLLTDLPLSDQQAQIDEAQQELEQYGASPTLFRPPYGAFNDFTEQVLAKDHLTLALWNRDPRDWADRNPQQLIDSVVNGNPSGGVFDLHDKLVTLEALPTIIEKLRARGLHFVVLGQALAADSAGSSSGGTSGFGSQASTERHSTHSANNSSAKSGASGRTENSTGVPSGDSSGNSTN